MASVTKDIGSADDWTDGLAVKGSFDLSISGVFEGVVTVQRSFDGGVSWADVDSFSAPIETFGQQPAYSLYRVGIAAGDYVSGVATVALIEGDLSD